MDSSHDGTCHHGLVAGTRVPTFMFLWQAAIFRQEFFKVLVVMWLNQHRCLHVFDESRDISPPPCPGAFINQRCVMCIQNTTKCCSERELWKWKRVSLLMIFSVVYLVEFARFASTGSYPIDELLISLIIHRYLIDILTIALSPSVDIANKLSTICSTDILWSPQLATLPFFTNSSLQNIVLIANIIWQ